MVFLREPLVRTNPLSVHMFYFLPAAQQYGLYRRSSAYRVLMQACLFSASLTIPSSLFIMISVESEKLWTYRRILLGLPVK
jgi:hypothetical protein